VGEGVQAKKTFGGRGMDIFGTPIEQCLTNL